MYCNKFNCKNQKLPLRSLHFGPWSRLWHSHSQSQSGNLSGKCIGNIYKCISRLHALVSACVCIYIYMHTRKHVYRNDNRICWSNDDEEYLCVWPVFKQNCTNPNRPPSSLSSSNAANQRSEARNKKHSLTERISRALHKTTNLRLEGIEATAWTPKNTTKNKIRKT